MAKDTKEKILAAALEMFAKNGYAGTNIRELTAALGLVKSSMYKHFESKEQIWNTLLDEMAAYYEAHFGSAANLPPVPDSLEALAALTVRLADFTLHDEKVILTRRVLTTEQFRDERAKELATKHFLTGLTEMFTPLFAGMMEKGLLRRCDPAMLAFAYTAPITSLIHLCDREPEKTPEALAQIEAFSRFFIESYAGNGFTVRAYLPGDETAMAELVAYTLQVSNRGDYTPAYLERIAESHSSAYFAERAKDSHFYVVCDRAKIVGCGGITGFHGSTQESYLISVFIHPDYQKKGLGRMILEALEADEFFTRARRIELAASITAAGFYRKLGYDYINGVSVPDGAGVIPMEKYNTDKNKKE